jgi:hypothetical protein
MDRIQQKCYTYNLIKTVENTCIKPRSIRSMKLHRMLFFHNKRFTKKMVILIYITWFFA